MRKEIKNWISKNKKSEDVKEVLDINISILKERMVTMTTKSLLPIGEYLYGISGKKYHKTGRKEDIIASLLEQIYAIKGIERRWEVVTDHLLGEYTDGPDIKYSPKKIGDVYYVYHGHPLDLEDVNSKYDTIERWIDCLEFNPCSPESMEEIENLAEFLWRFRNVNFSRFDTLCKTCTSRKKYDDLAVLGKEGTIGLYNLSYDDVSLYRKWLYKPKRMIEVGLAPGIGLSLGALYPGRKTKGNGMGMIGGVKL